MDDFIKIEIKKKQAREFRRKVIRKTKSPKRKIKKVICQKNKRGKIGKS